MKYTFDILGVSPVLYFFNQQQEKQEKKQPTGVAYIASYQCSLDALIQSVEIFPPQQDWDLEQVLKTVINFWINNAESIQYWKKRLNDAGNENLLVSRVADINSLRSEFELLLN